MTLEELAAQPIRLAGGDLEDLRVVAAAHVALADLGQLDDAAVLLEEAGGAGERDELARAAECVLEPGGKSSSIENSVMNSSRRRRSRRSIARSRPWVS